MAHLQPSVSVHCRSVKIRMITGEPIIGLGSNVFQSFNWNKYPTITGKEVFNDKVYTYSITNKKRLKTRIYYHNYVVYKERGVYAKVEKKGLLSWVDTKSSVINITWSNMLFTAPYANGQTPKGDKIICSGSGRDFSWQNKLRSYIIIRNYSIPESLYANYVKWNRGTLNTFVKNATDIDVSTYDVIVFEGKDYLQTVIHGTLINEETNVKELSRDFNHQWFSTIPTIVAGQFMYAAVNEGDFGAMRVGTAF